MTRPSPPAGLHRRGGGPPPPAPRRPPEASARIRDVEWTVSYVGFLVYVFVIVTFKLGIASLGMAVALGGIFLQRDKVRWPHYVGWMCALLAWGVIGYAGTDFPGPVMDTLIALAKLVLIAFAGANALRSRAQIRFFMLFFVVSYAVVPARTAIFNYLSGYTLFGRAVGVFIYQNPNDLAALTILATAISAALVVSEPRRSITRIGALVSVGVLLLLILMTQSRGAVVGVAAMTTPFWLHLLRRNRRGLVGAVALAVVVLVAAPDGVWERLSGIHRASQSGDIAEVDPEGSGAERFEILRTASRIVADHPLTGIGWGAYARANAVYNPELGAKDTHNSYFNLAAEVGIPGLLIFLALVWGLLRRARAVRRAAEPIYPEQAQQLRWLELGLIGYLTAGIFGSFAKLSFLYVFMTLLWCTAEALAGQLAALRRAGLVPRASRGRRPGLHRPVHATPRPRG